jgi:urease accessory protein
MRSRPPDEPGHLDVPVVTAPHVHVPERDLARLERDALVLTAEERRWGRRRVTTRGGRTLALALPTGSGLAPGDVLHVGAGWYVAIEAAPEPVLAVTPRSRDEMVRVAFEVGNRHFTLALDGERLLVPDDPAMDQLLTRLGVPFERERVPFVPVGTGHRHDHDHGH